MKESLLSMFVVLTLTLMMVQAANSQSSLFTYQGNLKTGGTAANGTFDFVFSLYASSSGGSPLNSIQANGVIVTDGVFTVGLSFSNGFPGADRFLEIDVRPAGGGAFTKLSPRTKFDSAPYAIKSLSADNALQLGGVAANQFASSPTGSDGFIRNTPSLQGSANFTIGGTGTAFILNAIDQYNIGGVRVFATPSLNTFAGRLAGNNTSGDSNSFFGNFAGGLNTSGEANSFFGRFAGANNSTGSRNSYFGHAAGSAINGGDDNAFFGAVGGGPGQFTVNRITLLGVGSATTANRSNSAAIGFRAFVSQDNSLVLGSINGVNSATADTNVGIGTSAPTSKLEVMNGEIRSTGPNGGLLAAYNPNNQSARVTLDWFNDGTNDFPRLRYGGSGAGSASGFLIQGSGDTTKLAVLQSGNVGIGTANPIGRLSVHGSGVVTAPGSARFDLINTASNKGVIQHVTDTGNFELKTTTGAPGLFVDSNGRVGIRSTDTTNDDFVVVGSSRIGGTLTVTNVLSATALGVSGSATLGATRVDTLVIDNMNAGATADVMCHAFVIGGGRRLGNCGSSIRFKTNVNPLGSGLDLVSRLRPVTFNWKESGKLDLGFIAEEVAEVEPLLATYNDDGRIQGVKYDRVSVVLVNAVREQQAEIESQRKEINMLRDEMTALKALLCASQATSTVCNK